MSDPTPPLPQAPAQQQIVTLDAALQHARALIARGDIGAAGPLLLEIRRQRPQAVEAARLQAEICNAAMNFPLAMRILDEAEALNPGEAAAPAVSVSRARALVGMAHYDAAIARLEPLAAAGTLSVEGMMLLADTLQRRKRFTEALALYDQVIAQAPDLAVAWCNRATALHTTGDLTGAMDGYRAALARDPKNIAAMNNLGAGLRALGRTGEAIDLLRRSLDTDPNSPGGWNNLGMALDEAGNNAEAAAAYRRAIDLDPAFSEAYGNLIFSLGMDPRTTQADHLAARRDWCRRFADSYAEDIPPFSNPPDPDRRLRIGYVSSDFRHHPASYVFLPVLLGHDPEAVSVHLYAQNVRTDEVTTRLRGARAVVAYTPIAALSDDAAAAQIRADGIDILVDLSGHSAGNRLLIFARKPAPIQISGWGHATGTGLATMDYLFADPWLVPPDLRAGIHETVLDLPAAQAYAPPGAAPPVAPLPATVKGHLTFGSFNRLSKLSDACLDLWAALLRAIPDARLLIKDRLVLSETQRRRVVGRLIDGGVAPARIELRGATEIIDHLGHYGDVDIHLDPMPQCGGITTLEALWMGVPTITLPGATVTGRFGASVLNSVGLPSLIAQSPTHYVKIAQALAGNPDQLAAVRAGLRARMRSCPILDAPRYAAAVEAHYRAIWRRWCAVGRQG